MQHTQLTLAFSNVPLPRNNRTMTTPLDQEEREKKEATQKLRDKALRLLTTREHSREELMRKLAQAKAHRARRDPRPAAPAKDDVERVVDDLAAQGWQSDDRYAEAIVRRLTGQAARRYIEDKMAQAGIKKDVAKLAMESLEQDEMEAATALWARRFGDAPSDDKAREKQIRFLLSRGFHLADAFKIVPKAPVVRSTVTPDRTDSSIGQRGSFGRRFPSQRAEPEGGESE
jgi:regulatory protein